MLKYPRMKYQRQRSMTVRHRGYEQLKPDRQETNLKQELQAGLIFARKSLLEHHKLFWGLARIPRIAHLAEEPSKSSRCR